MDDRNEKKPIPFAEKYPPPPNHPEGTVDGIWNFITTLRVHLDLPIKRDEQFAAREAVWAASMKQCLRPFCDEILAEGAKRILASTNGRDRRFPMPGQILRVLNEISEERYRKPLLAAHIDRERAYPYSRDRTRLIADMLRGSQVGRDAIAGNWVGALVDFCREHSRLPADSEKGVLIASGRQFDEVRGMCHAGVGWPIVRGGDGSHPLARMLARFADSIETRNQLWARVIRGEEGVEALFRPLDMAKTGT